MRRTVRNRILGAAVALVAAILLVAAVTYLLTHGDRVPDGSCVSDVVDTCEDQTYPS